ncbi:MAG: transglycosylase SLT domain-containing protein [Gemmobacter sp.]
MRKTTIMGGLAALFVAGCMGSDELSMRNFQPSMRWDHRQEAPEWTGNTLLAVAGEDDKLARDVPSDIATWCPGYTTATLNERRLFWVGLLSALAKHESTWNPRASGGGGRWIGLTQIAPSTARQYGCTARSTAALKDGAANLACAVEIMAVNVANDGMVAGSRGTRGLGRDWAPFRKASKRADMADWVSRQSYCQADQAGARLIR